MRGTSGSEREVWEATGAARRSKARRDAGKLPAGVSQDRQALFRPFPGSPAAEGTDAGRGAGSGGLWKLARASCACGTVAFRVGRGGFDPLGWPRLSVGPAFAWSGERGFEAPCECPRAHF